MSLHATEPLPTLHSTAMAVNNRSGAVAQSISEPLMVTFAMVVRRVFGECALEQTILFLQILDRIELPTIDPTGKQRQKELQRLYRGTLWPV